MTGSFSSDLRDVGRYLPSVVVAVKSSSNNNKLKLTDEATKDGGYL